MSLLRFQMNSSTSLATNHSLLMLTPCLPTAMMWWFRFHWPIKPTATRSTPFPDRQPTFNYKPTSATCLLPGVECPENNPFGYDAIITANSTLVYGYSTDSIDIPLQQYSSEACQISVKNNCHSFTKFHGYRPVGRRGMDGQHHRCRPPRKDIPGNHDDTHWHRATLPRWDEPDANAWPRSQWQHTQCDRCVLTLLIHEHHEPLVETNANIMQLERIDLTTWELIINLSSTSFPLPNQTLKLTSHRRATVPNSILNVKSFTPSIYTVMTNITIECNDSPENILVNNDLERNLLCLYVNDQTGYITLTINKTSEIRYPVSTTVTECFMRSDDTCMTTYHRFDESMNQLEHQLTLRRDPTPKAMIYNISISNSFNNEPTTLTIEFIDQMRFLLLSLWRMPKLVWVKEELWILIWTSPSIQRWNMALNYAPPNTHRSLRSNFCRPSVASSGNEWTLLKAKKPLTLQIRWHLNIPYPAGLTRFNEPIQTPSDSNF